ncbi:hypothetical protein ESCO_006151 [Escovopsis weberi]|uniref:Pal1-like protein n=1 Tax=Escovopsis weberi TaxID=150374 RepID=A0A0M8N562_ESCWE|nr:hypothetical protein ESCO_006151 [Escovopsis weberi]
MASAGNGARQIKGLRMNARSLRVLVTPTPITFAERRSVLQVLEQFGPIEMFKMSPGLYSNFVSMTREESTVQRLLSSSPLTYNFIEPARKHADDIHIADLTERESFASGQPSVKMVAYGAQPAPRLMRGPRPGQDEQESQRQFKLDIFPAPDLRHRRAMASSPLHGAWTNAHEQDRSFMATTLKQTLPQTMVGKGLAHWLVSQGTAYYQERKTKRLQARSLLPSTMKGEPE